MVSLFPHPASFRFHLAVDTLAFGCILPTTGRIRDFHPLETCAAGRTAKKTPGSLRFLRSFSDRVCEIPDEPASLMFLLRGTVYCISSQVFRVGFGKARSMSA